MFFYLVRTNQTAGILILKDTGDQDRSMWQSSDLRIFNKVGLCCYFTVGSLFCAVKCIVKKLLSSVSLTLTFCDITAEIYFLCADISLVWLPSAQRQPPVHRPSCIYAVIITKGELDQIAFLIYKECAHSCPDQKVTRNSNRLKSWNVGSRLQVKRKTRRKPETPKNKRRWSFVG